MPGTELIDKYERLLFSNHNLYRDEALLELRKLVIVHGVPDAICTNYPLKVRLVDDKWNRTQGDSESGDSSSLSSDDIASPEEIGPPQFYPSSLESMSQAGVRGTSLRTVVWKVLLGITDVNEEDYMSLVRRGPSFCAKRIATDLPRTLRGDLDIAFLSDSRMRLLNAYAHWTQDVVEAFEEATDSMGSSSNATSVASPDVHASIQEKTIDSNRGIVTEAQVMLSSAPSSDSLQSIPDTFSPGVKKGEKMNDISEPSIAKPQLVDKSPPSGSPASNDTSTSSSVISGFTISPDSSTTSNNRETSDSELSSNPFSSPSGFSDTSKPPSLCQDGNRKESLSAGLRSFEFSSSLQGYSSDSTQQLESSGSMHRFDPMGPRTGLNISNKSPSLYNPVGDTHPHGQLPAIIRNGYVQGMGNIAAVLLMALPEGDAFVAFRNLLTLGIPRLFGKGHLGVRRGSLLADKCLSEVDAATHSHLRRTYGGLSSGMHSGANSSSVYGPGNNTYVELLFFSRLASMYANRPPLSFVVKEWDRLLSIGPHYAIMLCVGECLLRRSEIQRAGRDAISIFQGLHRPSTTSESSSNSCASSNSDTNQQVKEPDQWKKSCNRSKEERSEFCDDIISTSLAVIGVLSAPTFRQLSEFTQRVSCFDNSQGEQVMLQSQDLANSSANLQASQWSRRRSHKDFYLRIVTKFLFSLVSVDGDSSPLADDSTGMQSLWKAQERLGARPGSGSGAVSSHAASLLVVPSTVAPLGVATNTKESKGDAVSGEESKKERKEWNDLDEEDNRPLHSRSSITTQGGQNQAQSKPESRRTHSRSGSLSSAMLDTLVVDDGDSNAQLHTHSSASSDTVEQQPGGTTLAETESRDRPKNMDGMFSSTTKISINVDPVVVTQSIPPITNTEEQGSENGPVSPHSSYNVQEGAMGNTSTSSAYGLDSGTLLSVGSAVASESDIAGGLGHRRRRSDIRNMHLLTSPKASPQVRASPSETASLSLGNSPSTDSMSIQTQATHVQRRSEDQEEVVFQHTHNVFVAHSPVDIMKLPKESSNENAIDSEQIHGIPTGNHILNGSAADITELSLEGRKGPTASSEGAGHLPLRLKRKGLPSSLTPEISLTPLSTAHVRSVSGLSTGSSTCECPMCSGGALCSTPSRCFGHGKIISKGCLRSHHRGASINSLNSIKSAISATSSGSGKHKSTHGSGSHGHRPAISLIPPSSQQDTPETPTTLKKTPAIAGKHEPTSSHLSQVLYAHGAALDETDKYDSSGLTESIPSLELEQQPNEDRKNASNSNGSTSSGTSPQKTPNPDNDGFLVELSGKRLDKSNWQMCNNHPPSTPPIWIHRPLSQAELRALPLPAAPAFVEEILANSASENSKKAAKQDENSKNSSEVDVSNSKAKNKGESPESISHRAGTISMKDFQEMQRSEKKFEVAVENGELLNTQTKETLRFGSNSEAVQTIKDRNENTGSAHFPLFEDTEQEGDLNSFSPNSTGKTVDSRIGGTSNKNDSVDLSRVSLVDSTGIEAGLRLSDVYTARKQQLNTHSVRTTTTFTTETSTTYNNVEQKRGGILQLPGASLEHMGSIMSALDRSSSSSSLNSLLNVPSSGEAVQTVEHSNSTSSTPLTTTMATTTSPSRRIRSSGVISDAVATVITAPATIKISGGGGDRIKGQQSTSGIGTARHRALSLSLSLGLRGLELGTHFDEGEVETDFRELLHKGPGPQGKDIPTSIRGASTAGNSMHNVTDHLSASHEKESGRLRKGQSVRRASYHGATSRLGACQVDSPSTHTSSLAPEEIMSPKHKHAFPSFSESSDSGENSSSNSPSSSTESSSPPRVRPESAPNASSESWGWCSSPTATAIDIPDSEESHVTAAIGAETVRKVKKNEGPAREEVFTEGSQAQRLIRRKAVSGTIHHSSAYSYMSRSQASDSIDTISNAETVPKSEGKFISPGNSPASLIGDGESIPTPDTTDSLQSQQTSSTASGTASFPSISVSSDQGRNQRKQDDITAGHGDAEGSKPPHFHAPPATVLFSSIPIPNVYNLPSSKNS